MLYNGTPDNPGSRIWQASMHRDYWDPQFATLENGQLKIYRGEPGNEEAELFSTPKQSTAGIYKFGITISRRLVIVREDSNGNVTTVWRSN